MRLPTPTFEHCLITGASSGIGAAFARALARRADVMTLVARREDRLRMLAQELSAAGGPRCEIIPEDLTRPDGVVRVLDEMRARSLPPVHLLVNNAGFGLVGRFDADPWEVYRKMIALNVAAASELLHRLLGELTAAPGRGAINVASAAGFQPIPHFAAYSATKAYLRNLSTAVAVEVAPEGTRLLSFCPGPVETEFAKVARLDGFAKPAAPVDAVVEAALRAYERGRIELIPGFLNWLLALSTRFAPLRVVLAISARVVAQRIGSRP